MQSKWKPELTDHRIEPWVPPDSLEQQGVTNEFVEKGKDIINLISRRFLPQATRCFEVLADSCQLLPPS
jgi:hypothetical protein